MCSTNLCEPLPDLGTDIVLRLSGTMTHISTPHSLTMAPNYSSTETTLTCFLFFEKHIHTVSGHRRGVTIPFLSRCIKEKFKS